jgi:hypothetical protein
MEVSKCLAHSRWCLFSWSGVLSSKFAVLQFSTHFWHLAWSLGNLKNDSPTACSSLCSRGPDISSAASSPLVLPCTAHLSASSKQSSSIGAGRGARTSCSAGLCMSGGAGESEVLGSEAGSWGHRSTVLRAAWGIYWHS